MMTCEEILKALRDGKAVKRRNEDDYFLLADDAIIKRSIKDNELVFSNLNFSFRLDEVKKGEFDFEIYEPKLTEEEKKYLSGVIKPFKKDYKIMVRKLRTACGEEYIYICFYRSGTDYIEGAASLPQFKANTMYAGMKARKEYSLEELGL